MIYKPLDIVFLMSLMIFTTNTNIKYDYSLNAKYSLVLYVFINHFNTLLGIYESHYDYTLLNTSRYCIFQNNEK